MITWKIGRNIKKLKEMTKFKPWGLKSNILIAVQDYKTVIQKCQGSIGGEEKPTGRKICQKWSKYIFEFKDQYTIWSKNGNNMCKYRLAGHEYTQTLIGLIEAKLNELCVHSKLNQVYAWFILKETIFFTYLFHLILVCHILALYIRYNMSRMSPTPPLT